MVPFSCCNRPTASRGFSLIELSVVVAIIAVVAALGLEAAASFINRSATSVSRDRLAVVDNAVAAFFKVYGRLPCPAVLAGASTTAAHPSNAAYGLEDCSTAAGHVIGVNSYGIGNGLYAGAVPFRTLNLAKMYSLDGFNSKVNYVVTANLTSAGGNATTDMRRFASSGFSNPNLNGTAGIEVRTGQLAQPCNASNCQVIADPAASPPSGAAYFIFSSGPDQRGAVSPLGTALNPCYTYANEKRVDAQNCVFGNYVVRLNLIVTNIPDNVYYDNRYNAGTNLTSYYDNVAVWRTKAQL